MSEKIKNYDDIVFNLGQDFIAINGGNEIENLECFFEQYSGDIYVLLRDHFLDAANMVIRDATKEALQIVEYLYKEHYLATTPEFEPLTDLLGLLSQISNMIVDLRKQTMPKTRVNV